MKKISTFLFCILTMHFVYSQSQLDSSLVAYFPFNGNDSDNSIYGNHPISNNATLAADRFGIENSAFRFNGMNTSIVIPSSNSLNTGSEISLCSWVKVSGFYYGKCQGNSILQKGNSDNNPGFYTMRFSPMISNCNSSLPDTLNEKFYGRNSGTSSLATDVIKKEKWYFVVYTYDGQYTKLYIDGKLKSTYFIPGIRFFNSDDLFLGRLNDPQYPYWLNGVLDDVRIYNRAITKDEIRKLYTQTPTANVTGNLFVDNDNNGIKDSSDFGSSYSKVLLSNGDFTFTDYQGDYDLYVDSVGCYSVMPDTSNPAYIAVPTVDSFCLSNVDTTITKNFRMTLSSSAKDSLQVSVIPYLNAARPGFFYPVVVNYVNSGNTILTPTVNFTFDTSVLIYDSSSATAVFQNWNILTLANNQLYPKQRNFFIAFFRLKTTAPLGDSVKLYCNITGGTATAIDSVRQRITGSYDPNDKQATPKLTTNEVAQGKYIDYIVRFENTGTDTAFTVMVTDEISPLLDLNSIDIIASSHSYIPKVDGRKITFIFNDILLPPTITDKIKSHGFIKFRIKPLSTLVEGTDIPNKAAIYFDFNVPIITNTAITKIQNPVIVPLKFVQYNINTTREKDLVNINNNWKTANEINVSHFNVQRSFNGSEFKTLSQVKANNKANNEYSFTDKLNNNSNQKLNLYYRIESVDNDGKISYSETKQVILNNKNQSITIYPNPSKDVINITRSNNEMQHVTINNTLGQTVIKTILSNQNQAINIKSLSRGLYFINIDGEVIKFIKD